MPGLSAEQIGSRSGSLTPRTGLPALKSASKVTSIIKKMPKGQGHRNRSASPSSHASAPSVSYTTQAVHFHDDRVQSVTVGVDPAEFGRVVSEAQRLLGEAEAKAASLEGLAREIYRQACTQVQHLMVVAENLHQSCSDKDSSIQMLFSEVRVVRSQLEEQIPVNRTHAEEIARLSSENSSGLRMLEQKECEIDHLIREVASRDESLSQHSVLLGQFKDRCADLESRLAASSAAHLPAVSEPSLTVSSQLGRVQLGSVQPPSADMFNHVSVIMEAIQDLSVRMTQLESNLPAWQNQGLSRHVGAVQSQMRASCQSHNVAEFSFPSRFQVDDGFVPGQEHPLAVADEIRWFGGGA